MAPRYNKVQLSIIEEALGKGFPAGSGVPWDIRTKVSFARTPEGAMNILAASGFDPIDLSKYGYGEGEVGVFQEGRVWRVDPPEAEWGDVLDIGGDVAPTVLSVLGGIGGGVLGAPTGVGAPIGAMAGSGAGGVAGEGISQGLAALFGAEEGVQPGRLALEAAMAPVGEVGGRIVTAGAKRALAPFKEAMTQRVSRIAERAGELDRPYGTEVAQRLPVSAQTESKTLGAIEQRVQETPGTLDPYIKEQQRPYQGEVENLLQKIGRKRFGPPGAGKEDVGVALTEAAKETKRFRGEAVDQAYDRVREMIAPNTPVIPEESIRVVETMWNRINRDPASVTFAGAREEVGRLLSDVSNIKTFGELDAFRENLGAKLGTPKGAEVFQVGGLEGQVRGLYSALRKDVDQFYRGGGVATEEATEAFTERAAMEAEEAAAKASAREETISLSQAIRNLGGMDVSGMAAEEMPGKVGKVLRSLQTRAKNEGRPIKGPDLMAGRLAEEYPELGIEDMRGLIDALRREDVFFDKVPTGAVENIEQAFRARPVTGEEVLGFDVPALERTIEEATSLDQLQRAFGRISRSFEEGEISQFQRDRLRNMANNMAAALGEPRAKARAGALAEEFAGFERRAGRLGEEVAEKAETARTVFKELADLDAKKALQVFNNEEQAASIVDKMARLEAAEIRTIKQKIGRSPVPAMAQMQRGTTPEGEQAWRLAQRSVFDHIAGKGTIDRTERMTNDMVVRSGEKMLTMLDKFKEGALEELLGDDAARELYNFAELISDANLAARFNENFSRTAGATWLFDLVAGLRHGFTRGIMYAAAKIGMANTMLKAVTTPGGKRWMTEGVLQGQTPQQLLEVLGRTVPQVGVRQVGPAAAQSFFPRTFEAQQESTNR